MYTQPQKSAERPRGLKLPAWEQGAQLSAGSIDDENDVMQTAEVYLVLILICARVCVWSEALRWNSGAIR